MFSTETEANEGVLAQTLPHRSHQRRKPQQEQMSGCFARLAGENEAEKPCIEKNLTLEQFAVLIEFLLGRVGRLGELKEDDDDDDDDGEEDIG